MNVAHTNLVRECLCELSPLGLFWSNDTPGLAWDRNGNPFKSGLTGSSDIVGCILARDNTSRFVAVECKTGTGDLSTTQRRFRDAVKRAGGIHVVARSVADLAPIKAAAA